MFPSCPQLTKLAVRSRRSPFGFICSTSNRALELLTESQKAISQGQPLPRQPWRRRPKQQGQGQGPAGREEQHGAAGGGGGVGAGISEDGSEVEALQEQHGVEDVNPGLDMKELQALFREDVGEANGEAGGGCDVYCDAAAELDGDVVMADMDVGDKGPLLRLCGGASVVAAGSTHTRPPSGGLRHLELYADAHLTDGQSVVGQILRRGEPQQQKHLAHFPWLLYHGPSLAPGSDGCVILALPSMPTLCSVPNSEWGAQGMLTTVHVNIFCLRRFQYTASCGAVS